MDHKTRKLMIIYKALYPRDDIDRQYMLRKVGERGLPSIDAWMQGLEDNIKKSKERLVTETW